MGSRNTDLTYDLYLITLLLEGIIIKITAGGSMGDLGAGPRTSPKGDMAPVPFVRCLMPSGSLFSLERCASNDALIRYRKNGGGRLDHRKLSKQLFMIKDRCAIFAEPRKPGHPLPSFRAHFVRRCSACLCRFPEP